MKSSKKRLLGKIFVCLLCCGIGLSSSVNYSPSAESTRNYDLNSSTENCKNDTKSEPLYRTKTGKCYRKAGCPCLKHSKIEVSKGEIKQADLKPCSKCSY